jgi:antitoxin component YwqK of YwqJK toxin-antitoxin module
MEDIRPQCFVCSQEEGPFMDAMPCACRGSISLHQECYNELKKYHSSCSVCHTEYPSEYRDGLRVERGFAEGSTHRYEVTVDDDGLFHGTYKEWNSNGKLIKEYQYDRDNKDGICKSFYPSGSLRKKYNYMNGNKDGLCIVYFEDGQIMEEINYSDGSEHGVYRRYFQNGKLAEECTYIEDVCQGIARTYLSNGQLHVCSSLKDGMLDGYMYTFDRDMKINCRELYREDRIIETIRY